VGLLPDRPRRGFAIALAVAALAAGAHPTVAAAQRNSDPVPDGPVLVDEGGDRDERLGRDPFGAMGGGSPFCRRSDLADAERRNCRGSGALSHPVRIDHYGFDIHIDTGVDNVAGNFAKGLQDIAQMLWMVLLYLVKGTTLGLEWAFSLDLLGDTMSGARRALERMHSQVIRDGWLFAAISTAGLWGIYRGLVQRRSSEAFTGLAATVALMVAGLVIVSNPVDTVGRASELANHAALGIVSGATTGSTQRPARGFGEAMRRVFEQAVLRPWCALQFSDVRFCLSSPREVIDGDDIPHDPRIQEAYARSPTVAELFLAFEPNGEDEVDQRNQLYEEWKDNEGDRLQSVVRVQKEASTGPRLALLAVIAIGQLGMVFLLGWLAIRLLGYGGLALVLLLAAPVMLLAPALGDSGRAAFVAWAKRLAGALVAKAVYAALLAVVLIATGALAEIDSLGWIAVWLLQGVVWWTLFLKREEIIALTTARPSPSGGGRSLLQRAHYTQRLAATALHAASGGKSAVAQQTLGRLRDRRAATTTAVQAVSERELRRQAGSDLTRRHHEARTVVDREDETVHDLKQADRALTSYDQRAASDQQQGKPAPEPTTSETTLLAHRAWLTHTRPPTHEVKRAREVVAHAARNEARGAPPVSDRDETAYIKRRRHEIDSLPVDHETNLRAAGIDPVHYQHAQGPDRDRLRGDAERALERERVLLATAPTAQHTPPTTSEISKARATFDSAEVRAARREQTRALRTQRRQARQDRAPGRPQP
jgi:hypothetical protein